MQRIEGQTSSVIKSDVLSNAINKTIFATGNDDLRPVMNGVFCQFSENTAVFVATDAHKLVRYTRTDARAGAGRKRPVGSRGGASDPRALGAGKLY